jgi:hypothetical protein
MVLIVLIVQASIVDHSNIQTKLLQFVRLLLLFCHSLAIVLLTLYLYLGRASSLSPADGKTWCRYVIYVRDDFLVFTFSAALAIIAEYSFYCWDQAPSSNDASLISAINVYKSSTQHVIVTKAVDKAFKEDDGHLFEKAKAGKYPEVSVFAERLAQIAVDNCLGMFHMVIYSYISFMPASSTTTQLIMI